MAQPDGPGVGRTFLRLGSTSFGGPVAHLGYFREALVARRGWLGDAQYADLVALAQFLPGPASSQVGMGIGLLRGGLSGSLRAWLGFTLPTAVLMIAAGLAVGTGVAVPGGLVAGLQAAAAAVVAQAVLAMARSLCRGPLLALLALVTGLVALRWPALWVPIVALLVAGVVGGLALRGEAMPDAEEVLPRPRLPRWAPSAAVLAFGALLVGLPVAARAWPGEWLVLLAGCYRAGALVFGGGHVVLPLLDEVAVGSGALDEQAFLAGYGLANAMPGPLFAFAGYVGAAAGGVALGIACLVAIFLPGWLLVVATLGAWHRLAADPRLRGALAALNAAVVGLLGAALWNPVLTKGITSWPAALVAAAAFVALVPLRVAPQVVVAACAVLGLLVLA
ncbi:MAG TPA: chromate efflux transporter [Candidatus Nanopelagicales bacterium]